VVDATIEDVSEDVSEDFTTAHPGPVPPALASSPATYRPPHPLYAPASYGRSYYDAPPYTDDDADAPDDTDEPHPLAQPFPQWLTLGTPIALALTLALVYVVETTLLGGDWATGALAVSFTAFALAVVTLALLIGRVALGRRTFGSVALAGLLALALVGAGAAGVAQANPLRHAQAQQAESNGAWQFAIDEYTQAGERPPSSVPLARVYSAWGEDLLRHGDYAGATEKLTTVTQTYARSGSIVTRARADLFKSYSLWIKSGAITLPFKQSLDFLASYSADPACSSACKQSIVDLTGQAHYQYGEQLVQASQFKQAITEFELIQTQFPKSTFAAPAHTAAAAAYWTLSQQLLTQDCVSAVPDYQILASRYGDTSQGQKAKTALAQPQTVKGTLTGFPNNPAPTLYLSKHINPTVNAYSHDYKATFDTQTGAFSFANVGQGSYYLTTYRKVSSTQEAFTYYKDTTSGKPYAMTVGPLCETDLGQLGY
jgi:tetratricopeptide (TPR) repeat protein